MEKEYNMPKNRTAKLTLSFFILCLLPFGREASAIFKMNQPTTPIPISANQSQSMPTPGQYVVQSGKGEVRLVSGMGTELPLNIALRMIMPADWKVSGNSKPDLLTKKVSWDVSNEPLHYTLAQIGQKERIRFFINLVKKEVTILPLRTVIKTVPAKPVIPAVIAITQRNLPPNENTALQTVPAKPIIPAAIAITQQNLPSNENPDVPQDTYTPPAPSILILELKTGSLRKQLDQWCTKQNWTMVWNSSMMDDYILEVSATFTGKFKSIVHEAFMVLRKTSDCALKPKFYSGNGVLEVRDI